MDITVKSLLEALEEMRPTKREDKMNAAFFKRRYSTAPSVNSSHQEHFTMMEFTYKTKSVTLVEARVEGYTSKVLLQDGERNFIYDTYLEAEVSAADILAQEDEPCQQSLPEGRPSELQKQ